MNIYQMTAKYKHLQTALECEPEDEEIAQLLAEIDDSIEEKADGYGRIIRNMQAEISGLNGEIDRLTKRVKSRENAVKRLKENLMYSMKETGKTKFKTELFSFGVAKNGGKAPLELMVLPEELPEDLRKVKYEPDNDAIRQYIEETGDFTYAMIKDRGEHLSIR